MDKDILILVVDDERDHADGIAEALEDLHTKRTKAMAVYNGADALEILREQAVDVVVTDLKLGGPGDVDGLDILKQAKEYNPQTEVILITAYATIDTCKEAIRHGAFDYLVKPIDIDQLRTLVDQACRKVLRLAEQRAGSLPTTCRDGGEFVFEGIKGTSPVMAGVFEVARRVAPADIPVLIEGESGTGKELLARAIHNNSKRRSRPFRPVNCAGLSNTLLESELFGHIKGAFTGASGDRKGLFEITDKGTMFLDEIGDMAPNSQAKLLRVIEDGIVVPVGSNKSVVADVRIISATNQSLTKLIEEKKFREDLYFRIKGVSISLPALRDRVEDIPVLCEYFLEEAAVETGSKVTGITDAAQAILAGYNWPGNIRQLRNCIRTMVVMTEGDTLDVRDIPPEIANRPQLTAGVGAEASPSTTSTPLSTSLLRTGLTGVPLNELEKRAIVETLAKTKGNREKAAATLGIGERTLYRKIKEYKL